jgi:hypothetical protein
MALDVLSYGRLVRRLPVENAKLIGSKYVSPKVGEGSEFSTSRSLPLLFVFVGFGLNGRRCPNHG